MPILWRWQLRCWQTVSSRGHIKKREKGTYAVAVAVTLTGDVAVTLTVVDSVVVA